MQPGSRRQVVRASDDLPVGLVDHPPLARITIVSAGYAGQSLASNHRVARDYSATAIVVPGHQRYTGLLVQAVVGWNR